MSRLALSLAVALAVCGGSGDALAHRMKLFATAEGAEVSGYAYFSPGGRAHDTGVTAALPDGTTVFQGRTDAQGAFRFAARVRADHLITADGDDGHEARFTIKAAELPDSLPTGGAPAPAGPAPSLAPAAAAPTADLAALIEQSVARQVRPLREQLDAQQDAVRLRDVVGGIGYIIGLAGLAYGLSARSADRRRRAPGGREETAR